MSSTYNIVITGIQAGVAKETAIKQLSDLLKVTEEIVASMLASPKFVVKSGIDLATAAKYEAALQQCGGDVIVEPDADANSLSFDLPNLQPHTAPVLPTSPEPEGLPGYTGMAFGAFLLVMLFYFAFNLLGLSHIFKGDTTFDRATLIGKSMRADIDEFRNSGGLENGSESTWRGYRVTSYKNIVYADQTNLLAMVTIGLYGGEWPGKKFATINNVKKSLAKDCGDNWTQNDAQIISDMHVATNNGLVCSIHMTDDSMDPVQITLMTPPSES